MRLGQGPMGGILSVDPPQSPMFILSLRVLQTAYVFESAQASRDSLERRSLQIFGGRKESHFVTFLER